MRKSKNKTRGLLQKMVKKDHGLTSCASRLERHQSRRSEDSGRDGFKNVKLTEFLTYLKAKTGDTDNWKRA